MGFSGWHFRYKWSFYFFLYLLEENDCLWEEKRVRKWRRKREEIRGKKAFWNGGWLSRRYSSRFPDRTSTILCAFSNWREPFFHPLVQRCKKRHLGRDFAYPGSIQGLPAEKEKMAERFQSEVLFFFFLFSCLRGGNVRYIQNKVSKANF